MFWVFGFLGAACCCDADLVAAFAGVALFVVSRSRTASCNASALGAS